MTDREKVIEALEICADGTNPCNKCPMKDKCKGVFNAAMVAAIKLLKEQEPVKPRYEEFFGNMIPRCGYCNGYIVHYYKYCPGCGKAVKWDE